MKIAIVTFDGFNEMDSFVALSILNRIRLPGWKAEITGPGKSITSMNGVVIEPQQPLAFASEADVVLFGSGMKTREIIQDQEIMSQFDLNSNRQLLCAQCSGAAFLYTLRLIENIAVCTDTLTRPWLKTLGARVVNAPFRSDGNIATAGGCLASQYLAMWIMSRGAGVDLAKEVMHYVAPVGQKEEYLGMVLEVVNSESAAMVDSESELALAK